MSQMPETKIINQMLIFLFWVEAQFFWQNYGQYIIMLILILLLYFKDFWKLLERFNFFGKKLISFINFTFKLFSPYISLLGKHSVFRTNTYVFIQVYQFVDFIYHTNEHYLVMMTIIQMQFITVGKQGIFK